VGEDDFAVEVVAMRHRVGENRVSYLVLVVTAELGATSRALLLVAHDKHSM
jgi:hypothetical protein